MYNISVTFSLVLVCKIPATTFIIIHNHTFILLMYPYLRYNLCKCTCIEPYIVFSTQNSRTSGSNVHTQYSVVSPQILVCTYIIDIVLKTRNGKDIVSYIPT